MTIDYAARAIALIGTRFRPQGRGPEGLDCIGLALAVYGIAADSVRRDYALKGDYESEVRDALKVKFRRIGPSLARVGDLMLMRVAPDQLHVAVRTELGFVHAHSALRRVVETPGAPQWPVIGFYRKRAR